MQNSMLIYMFGLIDLLSGIMLLTLKFSTPVIPAVIIAALLVLKSILYIKDAASWLDIASAFFMVLAIIGYYPIINYAFSIWLLQKGIRSFL